MFEPRQEYNRRAEKIKQQGDSPAVFYLPDVVTLEGDIHAKRLV